jgi:hypothetical protein
MLNAYLGSEASAPVIEALLADPTRAEALASCTI